MARDTARCLLLLSACSQTGEPAGTASASWDGGCPDYSGGSVAGVTRTFVDHHDEVVVSFSAGGTTMEVTRTTDSVQHVYRYRCDARGAWREGSETTDLATGALLYEVVHTPGMLTVPPELVEGTRWSSSYLRASRDLVNGEEQQVQQGANYEVLAVGGLLETPADLLEAAQVRLVVTQEGAPSVEQIVYLNPILGEIDGDLLDYTPPGQ